MYEAKRWNEDSTYFAPMVAIGEKCVFLGDVVTLQGHESQLVHGKTLKFMKFVRSLDCILHIH